MTIFGAAVSGASVLAGIVLLVAKLQGAEIAAGWTSLILSIWFLSGGIVACLGLIGVYIGKTYIQSKGRPRFVVRRALNARADTGKVETGMPV